MRSPSSLTPADRFNPSAKKQPTMYDLPSEYSEESGLPDEFHDLQPQLLSATLRLADIARDQVFTGTDLNLYYDLQHPLWHKRPDWFAAIGVPRLYAQKELRLSYVIWDEGVVPAVVVELLSPGTEKEDLGQTTATEGEPPTKWQVYEHILKIPYYILYDRYSGSLQGYHWLDGHYSPLEIKDKRLWLPQLNLGLGLWRGEYEGRIREWLRWLDADNHWIATPLEQANQQLVQAQAKAARLAEQLRAMGIDPDQI
ncbi:MAG: Uma2 family endonuclease [Acaryochloridaceae cyanobacterium CSU_3_4]|nr:Uma2 family endonuclease [Acaryochloridaceae cyanobacterium CSU_3_4]